MRAVTRRGFRHLKKEGVCLQTKAVFIKLRGVCLGSACASGGLCRPIDGTSLRAPQGPGESSATGGQQRGPLTGRSPPEGPRGWVGEPWNEGYKQCATASPRALGFLCPPLQIQPFPAFFTTSGCTPLWQEIHGRGIYLPGERNPF